VKTVVNLDPSVGLTYKIQLFQLVPKQLLVEPAASNDFFKSTRKNSLSIVLVATGIAHYKINVNRKKIYLSETVA